MNIFNIFINKQLFIEYNLFYLKKYSKSDLNYVASGELGFFNFWIILYNKVNEVILSKKFIISKIFFI